MCKAFIYSEKVLFLQIRSIWSFLFEEKSVVYTSVVTARIKIIHYYEKTNGNSLENITWHVLGNRTYKLKRSFDDE